MNGVKPGYIATPLVESLLKDKAKTDLILSRTPMRRVGDPKEIAGEVSLSPLPLCCTNVCKQYICTLPLC